MRARGVGVGVGVGVHVLDYQARAKFSKCVLVLLLWLWLLLYSCGVRLQMNNSCKTFSRTFDEIDADAHRLTSSRWRRLTRLPMLR